MRPGRRKGGKESLTHYDIRVLLEDEGMTERKISKHLKATGEQQTEVGKWAVRQL